MLLNDFFIVDDWQPGDGLARAILRINWRHPIFEGHFPGRPVVPGACLLQIMKELVSMALGYEIRLIRADQIKFISMIGPDEDETVWMNLTWRQAQRQEDLFSRRRDARSKPKGPMPAIYVSGLKALFKQDQTMLAEFVLIVNKNGSVWLFFR